MSASPARCLLPSDVYAAKQQLRLFMRFRLRHMEPNRILQQSRAACRRLSRWVHRQKVAACQSNVAPPHGLLLCCYLPMARELSLLPLMEEIWQQQTGPVSGGILAPRARTLVPYVLSKHPSSEKGKEGTTAGQMMYVEVFDQKDLQENFCVRGPLKLLEMREELVNELIRMNSEVGPRAVHTPTRRRRAMLLSDDPAVLFPQSYISPNAVELFHTPTAAYPCTGVPNTEVYDLAIFTPALCYDREGRRLGRGQGFYDRFIAFQAALWSRSIVSISDVSEGPMQLPANYQAKVRRVQTIGIGFDEQLLDPGEIIPTGPKDHTLDAVVTPSFETL